MMTKPILQLPTELQPTLPGCQSANHHRPHPDPHPDPDPKVHFPQFTPHDFHFLHPDPNPDFDPNPEFGLNLDLHQ